MMLRLTTVLDAPFAGNSYGFPALTMGGYER